MALPVINIRIGKNNLLKPKNEMIRMNFNIFFLLILRGILKLIILFKNHSDTSIWQAVLCLNQ